jgi:hypothetical protein
MPNTLLTSKIIARQMQLRLRDALVATTRAFRGYQQDFTGPMAVGESIDIRIPTVLAANEFTEGNNITVQTISEQKTSISIEKWFDTSVELGAKEATLSLEDFTMQFIDPAVYALADKVESYLLSKVADIPYYTNESGYLDSWAKAIKPRTALNTRKVPETGRIAFTNSLQEAALLGVSEFKDADKRGPNDAIVNGLFGRTLGIDWYRTEAIYNHTAGTFAGTPLINGAVSAGATTLNIDGGSGTQTLKKGDLFTVADAPGQYVVTEDAAATSGAITGLKFYPAAPTGGFGNDKAVTIVASHKCGFVGHQNALALIAPPLELPRGAAQASVVTVDGISIRVVSDYDIKLKKDVISFDLICGAKAIHPELGQRIVLPTT